MQAREVLVADETWVAVAIPPGQKVEANVVIGEDPVLRLAGALSCEETREGPLRGALTGEVASVQGGAPSVIDLRFAAEEGWWRHQVELAPLAAGPATLSLWSEAPEGCSLSLSDATLIHRVRKNSPTGGQPTQVLLISVDTLRRDAVGAFGGDADTPNLDRFAGQAERWDRHWAAASWTKPSHASMLTGYFPDTHRAIGLDQGMDPAIPTLADRFRLAGFATGAMVYDCTWLSPRWGFAKGFDSYRVTRWRAERQMNGASNWLLNHRDRPFLFFLHTFEPHSDFSVLPYEAPGINRSWIEERFGVAGFGCRRRFCASNLLKGLNQDEIRRRPKDVEILWTTYEAGVTYLDHSLGGLFSALQENGMWDNLLVVVTSDHGEEFAEHGGFLHDTLHEEILRVPLLIKWPGGARAGEVSTTTVSSIDLAPTLLAFAGLATEGLPGVDLRLHMEDQPVFAGTLAHAVVAGGLKAIFDPSMHLQELYDLRSDPLELDNLVGRDPEGAAELAELLARQRHMASALARRIGSGQDREIELGESERKRLQAFGYLH